ncbi:MAG: hypothetical protein MUP85_09420 [Candidatus Lokiarchaeota archaeon]|nr:hypothetical protein [Candidatus Lokiarchaeota archaeon]
MSDLLNKVKYPKECFGKIFVLNKNFKDYFKGWILIEGNLHQFLRNLQEEIDYEWEFKKSFIENFLVYFIDITTNLLVEVKDNKTLNLIRRKDKIFIVLLDKSHLVSDIKDIKSLYNWYIEGLNNYDL